jgi:hypothetical protein
MDEEELNGGQPDYGRPSATFSEESVASSYSPATDKHFQNFQKNQDVLKAAGTSFKSASSAADENARQLEDWGVKNFSKFYSRGNSNMQPDSTMKAQDLYNAVESGYSYSSDPVPEDWTRAKREWEKRTQQQSVFDQTKNTTGEVYTKLNSLNAQISPAERAAYESWKASSGGKKLNGKNSAYMDPQKAREVLDFIDYDDPGIMDTFQASGEGGLKDIDPRYSFKGPSQATERLNDKQRERRKAIMQGDMEAMWGEVSQAKKYKAAGYQTAPSWLNSVGGVSRMVGGEGEPELVLATVAEKAGIDYFTDESGNRVSVKDYINTSGYSDEERNALVLMNKLGEAKALHSQMQIDFWKDFDNLKNERDEDDLWGKMQLERQKRDSLMKQLSSMGYGREMINRSESVRDMEMLGGAWKQGSLQGDISDFSMSLFRDDMKAEDFQALSELAEQQQFLSEYLAANDDSPLAKISKLSAEQQDGWLAALGRWVGVGDGSSATDGIEALAELTVTQLSGFMWEYAANLPETVGAGALGGFALGSVTGPAAGAFAMAGAGHGARLNWGITSAAMEYASTIMSALQEEGVDVHNPLAFTAAWQNDEIKNKVREKAAKKTGIVALFDTVSAGLAGKSMALLKGPSAVTKVPGSLNPLNQNLKGLSKKETRRLAELKKGKRKGKVQRDSELEQEMMGLESKIQRGKFGTAQLDNDFKRALHRSDSTVNRTTWKHRTRGIVTEAGIQTGLAGAGEALSQIYSDPGAEVDKQAIFGEMMGEIGAGPALVGYAGEATKKPDFKNYENAVVESEEDIGPGDPNDPFAISEAGGTVQNVNISGWPHQKMHFNSAKDSVNAIAKQMGMSPTVTDAKGKEVVNPELVFQEEIVFGIQQLMNSRGMRVEFVVSDRTPSSNESPGEMQSEAKRNAYVVYINKKVLEKKGENLTGVLLHEIAHTYFTGIVGDVNTLKHYKSLNENQQKQAFAHYMFKDRAEFKDFENMPVPMQREFDNAWKNQDTKENELKRAHEWAAFEFARILGGSQRDYATGPGSPQQGASSQVPVALISGGTGNRLSNLPAGEAANVRLFIDKFIHPKIKKWAGSGTQRMAPNRPVGDDVSGIPMQDPDTGTRSEQTAPAEMDAQILEHMQFAINPNNQLVYIGPEKASRRSIQGDYNALGSMRNQLLSEEQFLKDMGQVFDTNPMLKDRVEITATPEKFAPLGEAYRIKPPVNADEDLGLLQDQDIEQAIEFGTDRLKKERLGKGPSEPQAYTDEQRATRRRIIINEMAKSDKKQKLKDLKKDPTSLKGEPVESTYTDAAKNSKKLEKAITIASRDASKPKKIRFKGTDYSVAEAVQLQEAYKGIVAGYEKAADDRIADEELGMNVGQKYDNKTNTFRPKTVKNKKGETIADPKEEVDYSEQRNLKTIADIEGTNKLLKEQGKSFKKVNEAVQKIIQTSDKKLLDDLLPDIEKLFTEKGRVTTEEIFELVADNTGLTAVADAALSRARGALSDADTIDIKSIEEAYEMFGTEEMSKKVELLQDKIEGIEATVSAERKLIKEMESESSVDSAEGISKTVTSLKNALGNFKLDDKDALGTGRQLEDFLTDTLTVSKDTEIEEVSRALSKFLSGPVLKSLDSNEEITGFAPKLDWLVKEPGGQGQTSQNVQKAQALIDDVEALKPLVQKITGIKNRKTKDKIARSRERIDRGVKQVENLREVKGSIGATSEVIDVRNTPVLINFKPDNTKLKGINFGDLRIASKDGKPGEMITLGDLASFDKLKVVYAKGENKGTFTINGKQELAKLADNFDWNMLPEEAANFQRETGQDYGVYQSRILSALAVMRSGNTIMTQYGPKESSYFKIDEGATVTATLLEKIARMSGVYKRLVDKAKKDPKKLTDLENKYGVYGLITDYESFAERNKNARRKRIQKLPAMLEFEGKQRDMLKALGLEKAPAKKSSLVKLSNTSGAKKAAKLNDPKIKEVWKTIRSLTKDKKLKKNVTFADLESALGLSTADRRMIKDTEPSIQNTELLPSTHLAINLTNSRIAERMGEVDTEQIGGSRYNSTDRAVLDYALYTERELIKSIKTIQDGLASGRVAPKKFAKDENYKIGELFYLGGELYRAKNNFRVTSFKAFDILEHANPASYRIQRIGGKLVRSKVFAEVEEGTIPLTDEARKKAEQDLTLLQKRLNQLQRIYGFEFFHSDAASMQAKYKNQAGMIEGLDLTIDPTSPIQTLLSGGPIPATITTQEYRHLLQRMHEDIALSGKNNAFQDALKGGYTTGSMFDPYNTASVQAAKGADARMKQGVKAILPTSDKKIIDSLVDTIIRVNKRKETEEAFNDYDPNGLDWSMDLGREYVQMLADGDLRLPPSRRGIMYKGRWIDDLKTILNTPKFKKIWDQQQAENRRLVENAGLPMSLDLQGEKSDVVKRAIEMSFEDNRQIHHDVRNHLEGEIAAEKKRYNKDGRLEVTVNPVSRAKLLKGTKTKLPKDETGKVRVFWNPEAEVPRTAYIKEAVSGSAFVNQLKSSLGKNEPVLIAGKSKIHINGYTYTAKRNITIDMQEAKEIQEIFNQHLQQGWIREEADINLVAGVLEKYENFTRSKKRAHNDSKKVTLFHDEVENIKDRKTALLKKLQKDNPYNTILYPTAEDIKNDKKVQESIAELQLELDVLKDFREGKLTKPKDWRFRWFQGDEIMETTLVKDGKDWVVQINEKGSFEKRGKNGRYYKVSEEVNNSLLSEYALENYLKTNEDIGRTVNGKVRDDISLSQTITNLSSLKLTARQLIQAIVEMGGLKNIGLLDGSHNKYYADSHGGIALLKYVTHAPDILLNKLEEAGALEKAKESLEKQIKFLDKPALKSSYKVRQELNYLQERLAQVETDLENEIPLSTKVLLNYVASFRLDQAKKMAPVKDSPRGFSKADMSAINLKIENKAQDNIYVATLNKDLRNGQVIKVGMIPAEKDDDGKVIQKAFPAYARVHVDDNMKNDDGSHKKTSFSDFTNQEENAPTNIGSLETRWPSLKSKSEKKEDKKAESKAESKEESKETQKGPVEPTFAFPYRLELVYDETQIEATFRKAEQDSYASFKEGDKARIATINELLTQLENTDMASAEAKQLQLQSKFAKELFYLEADNEFYNKIMDDMKKPNSKYMQAKLQALQDAVFTMGGLQLTSAEDVLASESKIIKDAQVNRGVDEQGFNEDGTESQEGVDADSTDNQADPGTDTSEAFGSFDSVDSDKDVGSNFLGSYEPKMFSRPGSLNAISKLASTFTSKYTEWREKAKNPTTPPDELDINIGQKGLRKFSGLHGKLVEQFGPWMQAQDHIIEKLGYDKKGEDAKRLQLYDTFYSQMGIAGDLLDEGQRAYINPISDALYDSKAELEDIGYYMYALVAPQANAAVRKSRQDLGKEALVDENGDDRGSGMTNKEAKKIIQDLEKNPELVKFIKHRNNPVKLMFDMHKKSLDLQYEAEMLDTKSKERMEAAATVANKGYDKTLHTLDGLNFGSFRRLPLQGFLGMEDQYARQEEQADLLGSGDAQGRGFDMPHGAVYQKSATGRSLLADPKTIFAHTTQGYQYAVIRSTRAKSAQAINQIHTELYNAKIENKDSPAGKLYDVLFKEAKDGVKLTPKLIENSDGETLFDIQEMKFSAEVLDSGRALFVREDGRPKVIMFADTEQGNLLASSAKNMTYEQLGQVLSTVNISTKYLSKIRTSYSPTFWIRNPLRDVTNAWFNLDSDQELKVIKNKVANPIGFHKMAGDIFAYEKSLDDHGKAPNNYAEMSNDSLYQLAKTDIGAAYHLLKLLGGKTAFYKFNEIRELLKQNEKASKTPRKGGKVVKPIRAMTSFVDNLNTSLENVLRARVIMYGLQEGIDIRTLIPASRNVTVDFNKRGTWSQQMGVLVQFFNPGIQGNRVFAKSLKKRGLQSSLIIGGKIVKASIAYNMLMRALTARDDDEEDDKSTYFDDVSDHARYTSVVMPHSLFSDERTPGHTTIPVGYGPHGLWALGDFLSKQLMTGGRDVVKDSLQFVKVMSQTYSPYAPTSLSEAVPVPALQGIFQIGMNEQWNGNTIYKEFSGSETASPSILSKRNTPQIYKNISDGINAAAGGNKAVPGNLLSMMTFSDPLKYVGTESLTLGGGWSGSGLEWWTDFLGGSLATGFMDGLNMFTDDPQEPQLPIIKGVVKMRGSSFKTYNEYNSLKTRAQQAKSSLDSMDPGEKAKFLKSNSHYLKIIKAFESSENAMKMYRRRREALEKQDQKDEGIIQQLDKLEDMRDNIQRRSIGIARDMGIAL